jgi:hypothetical protein
VRRGHCHLFEAGATIDDLLECKWIDDREREEVRDMLAAGISVVVFKVDDVFFAAPAVIDFSDDDGAEVPLVSAEDACRMMMLVSGIARRVYGRGSSRVVMSDEAENDRDSGDNLISLLSRRTAQRQIDRTTKPPEVGGPCTVIAFPGDRGDKI